MITNKFDRRKLCEGRNFGFGFSILKKEEKENYTALMAFTACKDFLNDFIYIETTGKPLGAIYSFKHEYTGIFKDQDHFYLGFTPVHYNGGQEWNDFKLLEKTLESNLDNLIIFLNKIERLFGLEEFTKLEYIEQNIYILKVPIFWTKFGHLLSLYMLLIRCFINITKEELNKDIRDILNDKKSFIIIQDNMLFQSAKKFVEPINLEKLLNYIYPDNPSPSYIHNYGIVGRLNDKT